ncbi:hypothetical protein [Veillonella orientalis]
MISFGILVATIIMAAKGLTSSKS